MPMMRCTEFDMVQAALSFVREDIEREIHGNKQRLLEEAAHPQLLGFNESLQLRLPRVAKLSRELDAVKLLQARFSDPTDYYIQKEQEQCER